MIRLPGVGLLLGAAVCASAAMAQLPISPVYRPGSEQAQPAPDKRPLDHDAYVRWSSLNDAQLTRDGRVVPAFIGQALSGAPQSAVIQPCFSSRCNAG